jgi:hypothetical protein
MSWLLVEVALECPNGAIDVVERVSVGIVGGNGRLGRFFYIQLAGGKAYHVKTRTWETFHN